MPMTFKQVFLNAIDGHEENVKNRLASGCASDYSEYNRQVGILHGIGIAKREFLEISEKDSGEM